jgi:ABC-2 type transport system permease protein
MLIQVRAMVLKDLQMFFSDRRAVIMSFVLPIAIASFFGSIFAGSAGSSERARIAVAIVDEDRGAISTAIVSAVQADPNLNVSTATAAGAGDLVRRGKTTIAVIVPPGFGDAAGRAFFGGGAKPPLDLLYDPSHNAELAMVRGILTEHVMEAVSRQMFGGAQGKALVAETLAQIGTSNMAPDRKRALLGMMTALQTFYAQTPQGTPGPGDPQGITMPYTVNERAMTSGNDVAYNGYAHAFAGMGIQFLLFAAASLGVEILLERQRGLWRRLRSAPVSRIALLAGKAASMTLIALMTLLVSFAFAMVVFRVRIQGSVLGFLIVSLACSVMAATFGLLIAALGRTPAATRGVTTLAVLMMVMLGGAWVPTFVFPAWMQTLTLIVPARWAVDGLDAMTWRGIGLAGAVLPAGVLLGFAALFGAIALAQFRWEEA